MTWDFEVNVEAWEEDGEYMYYVSVSSGDWQKPTILAKGSAESKEDATAEILRAVKDVLQ